MWSGRLDSNQRPPAPKADCSVVQGRQQPSPSSDARSVSRSVALSLFEARRKAREVLGDVASGDDPAQDKQERRDAETFHGLAKAYLEMAQKRHRSWKEEERIINKDLLPDFGHRLLVDIRRRDLRDHVEAIARKRNAPIMANRTLGAAAASDHRRQDEQSSDDARPLTSSVAEWG